MNKTITVFTPTYNRAYCLDQCYLSLVNQTCQDFIWLVIDDGSTDNTKDLVESWIAENKITIKYHYQDNLGMHGGHNAAYKLINTELNVCIDSDDFMPKDAVDKILSLWRNSSHNDNIAGMVALDSYKDGKIIGTKIPEFLKTTTLSELYQKHNVKGDKKVIYRTEIVQKYPAYPIFPDEKFVPLGILYLQIDRDYKLLPLNEVVCIVEYLPDGSSLNIFKQYRRHPRGFAYSREVTMEYGITFTQKFKNAIHYVASNIQLKNASFLYKTKHFFLVLFAIPFGIILYIYIRFKSRT